MSRPVVIGVTGRAGSGKSTVAAHLVSVFKFHLIDLDKLGHQLLQKESVLGQIIAGFGSEICDEAGLISREKLGKIVFSTPTKRELLNKIIHPEMKAQVQVLLEENADHSVLIEGALIEEIGLVDLCDEIIAVDASDDKILEISGPKKLQIAAIQKDREWYEAHSDSIIRNEADQDWLLLEAEHVVNLFLSG